MKDARAVSSQPDTNDAHLVRAFEYMVGTDEQEIRDEVFPFPLEVDYDLIDFDELDLEVDRNIEEAEAFIKEFRKEQAKAWDK